MTDSNELEPLYGKPQSSLTDAEREGLKSIYDRLLHRLSFDEQDLLRRLFRK